MRLTAFRICRFRSIQDSGWVEVSPLTVLVGKNESGKTSLLEALHKFNPFRPEPYRLDREWPRGQRRQRNEEQEVCVARFALTEEESAQLYERTGGQVDLAAIEVARDYKGRVEVKFPSGTLDAPRLHPNPVDAAVEALPKVPEPVGEAFRGQARQCIADARRLAYEGHFCALAALADQHRVSLEHCLNPWNAAPRYENEQEYVRQYFGQFEAIRGAIPKLPPRLATAHEFVVENLPTFLLMDEYRAFRGSAALNEVLQRKHDGQMTGEDRTLEMVFDLSGLSLEHEVKRSSESDHEQRQYDLDDAAAQLTRTIEGRWKQLRYEVKFAADGHHFFTFVKDQRDQALIKLEERSKGFQWFFSFDLMFMYESQGQFRNCVILLDEPGLSLHATAQRDLLGRLEEYAASNTLIYTTHLPSMIELSQPDRLRVLNETPEGTVVTSDLTQCEAEAKFTLEAALAIGATSSMTQAARNLIIEGVDDYWIISELSSLFVRSGLEGLPDDILVTPAASAADAAYLATLMVGRAADVVVLLSAHDASSGAAAGVIKGWISRYQASVAAEVLTLAEVAGAPGAENLFPEEFYLDIVQRIYKKEMASAGLKKLTLDGNERRSRGVENALFDAAVSFNSRAIATVLRSAVARMKTVDELPGETRAAAERVFGGINAIFSKEKHFWVTN